MNSSFHVLVVRVRNSLLAVPLQAVSQVVRFVEVTSIPDPPDACLGMVNVRGDIVPVFEPMFWISGEFPLHGIDDRLLITEVKSKKVAFAIDHVLEVRWVETHQMVFTESRATSPTPCVFDHSGELCLMLDLSSFESWK